MTRRWTRLVPVLFAAALLSGVVPPALTGPGPAAGATSVLVGTGASGGPSPADLPAPRQAVAPAYVPAAGVVDSGPLPASTVVQVVVGLASSDPQGLASLAAAASAPGTPLHPRHLSATDAAARFGSSAAARATAEHYFAGFGLTSRIHADGLVLSLTGPAGAMGRAFGTTFDLYHAPSGGVFYAHPSPATLPRIAPWSGVYGLGNLTAARPMARPAHEALVAPAATCSSSAVLTPCQVQTAYQFSSLLANGTNGSGRRIGIVDAYSSLEGQNQLLQDLTTFSNTDGLPPPQVTFLYPVPTTANLNASGTNPDWEFENALDLEWAHAAAPGAQLYMTFSPDSGAGLYFAIDALVAGGLVDVISLSWGEPDVGIFNAYNGPCNFACNASTDGTYGVLAPVLQLAAVEGISTFAASGDCGAADGTSGVSTNYPASDPYVTGVGGTNLSITASSAWSSEVAWSGNRTGASYPGCKNQGGSGGGYAPFPRPWWQHGPGITKAQRGVPDVALDAGIPVKIVLGGIATSVGGTSVGTPVWAGIAALADQYAGGDLGLLNPSLYTLLRSPTNATIFHDIVTGSNGYPAGAGWDPVTGVGSPIVASLVPALRGTITTSGTLQTFVYASPRFGPAPLTTKFSVSVHGGSGTSSLEGIVFGDGNASLTTNGTVNHTYHDPGVYSAQSFVVDSTGNLSTSPPVVVVVGGGGALTVTLTASNTTPAVDSAVTFAASIVGGTPPYLLNVSFGDGSFAQNLTTNTTYHAFRAAGSYCVEAVVRDAAHPPNGGASARLAVVVGGAAAPSCGNPAQPLTITPLPGPGVRDAPADYPALFTVSGGATAPGGLLPTVTLLSEDPYTSACRCTIFRAEGNYTVQKWENDTVNGQANATAHVTVAPRLNATFYASTLSGPAPLVVNFSVVVVGGYRADATSARWSFGNGQTARGTTAQATYATAGEYVAVGALSDAGHGNASTAFVVDVRPSDPTIPGVSGTISPVVNISSGTNVTFNATIQGSSSALSTAELEWDLGNGGTAFGAPVTETYLVDQDPLAGDTLAAGVSIVGPHLRVLFHLLITLPSFFATETAGFVPAASALAVSAEVQPSDGVVPLPIWGNASASGPGGANVAWFFGDAGSASGMNVTHTYYGVGPYTVRATAYDPFHDEASRLVSVLALPALTIAGGPSPSTGDAPLTVNFSVYAYGGAGPPYTYNWSYPGGSRNGSTNLSLTFARPGSYSVTLNVTDRANASLVLVWTITVSPAPPISAIEIVVVGVLVGALIAVLVWRRPPTDLEPFTL